ncbi:MAG: segregation/condensation protein A [Candidatus Magasanikbacteria bacterium]|nr:segregation/condensation protein A [Candidatus Magasanikbacteria bacterium]
MVSAVTLEKFQGPLDLLLQLIEEEKMAITEVNLSEVTEQFFKYLQTLEETNPEELADFLIVASRLVYLKSRHLLPYLYPPEEDEGASLADQLKLYKRYADASRFVEERWNASGLSYGRLEPMRPPTGFVLPLNGAASDLHHAFILLVARLKPIAVLPKVSIDHAVSIKDKIAAIYDVFKRVKEMSFKDLLSGAANRTEVIVSFLAILELIKEQKVSVTQSAAFADMTLNKV